MNTRICSNFFSSLQRPAANFTSERFTRLLYQAVFAAVLMLFATGAHAVKRVESVVATPGLIFVDTPTTVRFAARVAPDDDLIPASVRLLQLRDDGRPLRVVAAMSDDGTGADTTAGDLVFTAEIGVTVSTPTAIKYQVSVAYRRTLRRTMSDIVVVRTELAPFFMPSDPALIITEADGVQFPTNEVLIGLIADERIDTANEIAVGIGAQVVGFAPSGNLYQLLVPASDVAGLNALIAQLLADPRITLAVPNFVNSSIVEPDAANNDAQALPASNRIGYDQMNASRAWDLLFDTGHMLSPVVVGVLDRGFQNHPEFSGVPFTSSSARPDAGWPARAGCSTGSVDHGTAVAGVIGAENSGGTGAAFQTNGVLAGVTDAASPTGSRVPYKLSTRDLGDSAIAAATHMSQMIAAGARVINMSYGGSRKSALPVDEIIVFLKSGAPAGTEATLATLVGGTVKSGSGNRFTLQVPATTDAQAAAIVAILLANANVESAKTKRSCFGASDANFTATTTYYMNIFASHTDVLFVVSAGNSSISASDQYPAGIDADNVLTIGATDGSSDAATAGVASFSNTGASVDLAAPGRNVYAPTNFTAPLDAADYRRVSGTSFSAPLTAGAIGLMYATDETLQPDRLRKILLATATDNAGVASISGKVLDLGAAIEFLLIPVDVFLIVDTSGSFRNDLASFRAEANTLVTELDESGLNIHIGLSRFEDYPISPWGGSADRPYRRVLDIQSIDDGSGNKPIITAINSLVASGGSDGPESQLVALFQAATGAGQTIAGHAGANIAADQGATFRPAPVATLSPVRIMILWTDARFHTKGDSNSNVAPVIGYPGPSFAEAIAALNAMEIQVIGISAGTGGLADLRQVALGTNTLAPAGGVNCDADAFIEVPEGQPIVCEISTAGTGIGEAVFATVLAAVKM